MLEILSTILVVSVFCSFLLSFPIISILYRFKIVRQGGADFSNVIAAREKKLGTPIMGGLVVVITVILLNIIFNRDFEHHLSGTIKVPLFIFGVSALLGFLDDLLNIFGKKRKVRQISRVMRLIKVHKSLWMRIKLVLLLPLFIYKRIFFILGSNPGKGIQADEKVIVQIFVGFVLGYWLYFTSGWLDPGVLWVPVLDNLDIGQLMIPFVIFTVVSMSNAVNISDGMDGLAAGLSIISLLGFLIISVDQNNLQIAILIVTIIGSLVSYLYFNAPPARFQMGDVGSLALGTAIASIGFALRVPLLIPIICLPFVLEISSSLIQGVYRRVFGVRFFKMAPLHHHFEIQGWDEEKVVIRFWILAIVSTILGVWVYAVFYSS